MRLKTGMTVWARSYNGPVQVTLDHFDNDHYAGYWYVASGPLRIVEAEEVFATREEAKGPLKFPYVILTDFGQQDRLHVVSRHGSLEAASKQFPRTERIYGRQGEKVWLVRWTEPMEPQTRDVEDIPSLIVAGKVGVAKSRLRLATALKGTAP